MPCIALLKTEPDGTIDTTLRLGLRILIGASDFGFRISFGLRSLAFGFISVIATSPRVFTFSTRPQHTRPIVGF